ncbi:MAG TPA: DUF981 domain-containing protein [Armatimonadota bacterium]
MLFIDFLTLLLVNMAAGFALLAHFVFRGLDREDQRAWVPGFAMVGAIAVIFGGYQTLCWPLPGQFNTAFGEMSVLLGTVFLGAALALGLGRGLGAVTLYAFFAGLAAMVVGVSIYVQHLTASPLVTAAGFLLSGLAGVCSGPTLLLGRRHRLFRVAITAVLLGIALLWMAVAYPAYWGHMSHFGKWEPVIHQMLPPG